MRSATRAYVALGLMSAAFMACGKESTKEPESPTPASMVSPEPTTAPATEAPPPTTETSKSALAEQPPAEPAPKVEPLNDDQIATVVDGANTAEIDQAKAVQGKSKNAKVKKFAAMMIADHTQAKQKQNKLKLGTADSPLSTQLGMDAANAMSSIKTSTGAELDRTYMQGQVDAHRKLLDALDNRLIPNVKSAELKTLLEEVRPKVEKHLKEAEEILAALPQPGAEQPAGAKAPGAGTGTTGTGTKSGTGATGTGGPSSTAPGTGATGGTTKGTGTK